MQRRLVEGAVDVTRRYVRDQNKALPRDKINESSLTDGLKSLTNQLRESLPADQRDQLIKEDAEEEKELQSNQGNTPTVDGLGPRESGSADWKKSRGEDGSA
ncbi:hypothetical protein TRICI_000881 [Trichomonascus ciferrii]|uniref:Uncharacterized protein n=1 Tax=Trichomonascus ciferrii TaxID=44093 RepID=A0A642VB09_9ASCO|nr:hypothetical protein TRICI_000881 [Trichomonascus ciferrii]